ncbi:programmed cell death 1 ligand 1-like [Mantella aurantiaca]
MVCHFPLEKNEDLNKLKVSWQHHEPYKKIQVVKFNNGKEEPMHQDNPYRGRASLLTEELKKGEAILQIKDVKLTDAGTYLCILQSEGSDYDKITLEVQASYTDIQMSFQVSYADNEIYLTCHSLGFPKASVYWTTNGVNISFPGNTSHNQTKDGFYNTTSTIKILDRKKSYSCVFWNEALNETTEASMGHPETDNYDSSITMKILIPCMAVMIIGTVVIIYTKRQVCFKGFRKKGMLYIFVQEEEGREQCELSGKASDITVSERVALLKIKTRLQTSIAQVKTETDKTELNELEKILIPLTCPSCSKGSV